MLKPRTSARWRRPTTAALLGRNLSRFTKVALMMEQPDDLDHNRPIEAATELIAELEQSYGDRSATPELSYCVKRSSPGTGFMTMRHAGRSMMPPVFCISDEAALEEAITALTSGALDADERLQTLRMIDHWEPWCGSETAGRQ